MIFDAPVTLDDPLHLYRYSYQMIGQAANRAGMGIGTVYRHFPTKEELIEAVVFSFKQRLIEKAREMLEQGDPGQAFFNFLPLIVREHGKQGADRSGPFWCRHSSSAPRGQQRLEESSSLERLTWSASEHPASGHSYRSASIGFSCAAFRAGYTPKIMPTAMEDRKE